MTVKSKFTRRVFNILRQDHKNIFYSNCYDKKLQLVMKSSEDMSIFESKEKCDKIA